MTCTFILITRGAPPVVTWLTPIIHPNILPPERNGGVCLGAWSASESLADVARRLIDLVTYRAFNISDALDRGWAEWLRERDVEPGIDAYALIDLAKNSTASKPRAGAATR